MSDQATSEPTMEEILASIRRIISEDDAPAEDGGAAQADSLDAEADILELSEPLPMAAEPEPLILQPDPIGDLELIDIDQEPAVDFSEPAAPPVSMPAPSFAEEALPPVSSGPLTSVIDALVAPTAASAAASAFNRLSGSVSMPKDSTSLDDVVRELLRPLLKQWLDDNLPRIVEAKVEQEVQRIARSSL